MSSNGESDTCPIGSTQSVAESVREAAEMVLPGMARIREGWEAVFLEDQRALAKADREKVRKLEAKKLWGVTDVANIEEPEMGNLVLAGDIHVNSAKQVGEVLGALSGQPQLPRQESPPEPRQELPPEPRQESPPEPRQESPTPKMPGWAKLAGTALASAGISAASILGYGALRGKQPVAVTIPPPVVRDAGTDRWMEYNLKKWIPGSQVPHE